MGLLCSLPYQKKPWSSIHQSETSLQRETCLKKLMKLLMLAWVILEADSLVLKDLPKCKSLRSIWSSHSNLQSNAIQWCSNVQVSYLRFSIFAWRNYWRTFEVEFLERSLWNKYLLLLLDKVTGPVKLWTLLLRIIQRQWQNWWPASAEVVPPQPGRRVKLLINWCKLDFAGYRSSVLYLQCIREGFVSCANSIAFNLFHRQNVIHKTINYTSDKLLIKCKDIRSRGHVLGSSTLVSLSEKPTCTRRLIVFNCRKISKRSNCWERACAV